MTYDDKSPERRNLVVTSLAFIVFALGGGEVTGDAVNFQIVDVKFTNVGFLIAFAWIALIWFLYRYWLLVRGEFKRIYSTEYLDVLSKTKSFTQYVDKWIPAHDEGK